jgi:CPA2 family monovalent cation:H+ antiporter-2
MFSLMLASAGVSIVLAPPINRYAPDVLRRLDLRSGGRGGEPSELPADTRPSRRHAIICGYGRVGRLVGAALERRGFPYLVIEVDPRICRDLRDRGIPVIQGLSENPRNLARAELSRGTVAVVTVPDPFALQQTVHYLRRDHPRLPIIARARTAAERALLQREGVGEIVVAETEVALEMARYTLGRVGVSAAETAAIVQGLRRRVTGG